MARKDDSSDTKTSSTTSDTSASSDDSSTTASTDTAESDGSEVTTVAVTPDTDTTSSGPYAHSLMVQRGEWRPETHGMPPDLRPTTDI